MCATADERLWNHAAKEKERDREGAQRTRCEHWRNVAASRSWRVGGGGGGGGFNHTFRLRKKGEIPCRLLQVHLLERFFKLFDMKDPSEILIGQLT